MSSALRSDVPAVKSAAYSCKACSASRIPVPVFPRLRSQTAYDYLNEVLWFLARNHARRRCSSRIFDEVVIETAVFTDVLIPTKDINRELKNRRR